MDLRLTKSIPETVRNCDFCSLCPPWNSQIKNTWTNKLGKWVSVHYSTRNRRYTHKGKCSAENAEFFQVQHLPLLRLKDNYLQFPGYTAKTVESRKWIPSTCCRRPVKRWKTFLGQLRDVFVLFQNRPREKGRDRIECEQQVAANFFLLGLEMEWSTYLCKMIHETKHWKCYFHIFPRFHPTILTHPTFLHASVSFFPNSSSPMQPIYAVLPGSWFQTTQSHPTNLQWKWDSHGEMNNKSAVVLGILTPFVPPKKTAKKT